MDHVHGECAECHLRIVALFVNKAPHRLDLEGIDHDTFAHGINYGFRRWQHAYIAASRWSHVNAASFHWEERHITDAYLRVAGRTDELGAQSRKLINLAHPDCESCGARLATLRG